QLFWSIRIALLLDETARIEREKKSKASSEYDYPLSFHNEMLRALLMHARQVNSLITDYKVPRAWAESYLRSTDVQLVKELVIFHWYMPGWPLQRRVLPEDRGAAIAIFDAIHRTLQIRWPRKGAKQLAFQLTSLICSSPASIAEGWLDPDPNKIRER